VRGPRSFVRSEMPPATDEGAYNSTEFDEHHSAEVQALYEEQAVQGLMWDMIVEEGMGGAQAGAGGDCLCECECEPQKQQAVVPYTGKRKHTNVASKFMLSGQVLLPDGALHSGPARAAARGNLAAFQRRARGSPGLDVSNLSSEELQQRLLDLRHDVGLQARWYGRCVRSGKVRLSWGASRTLTQEEEAEIATLRTPAVREYERVTRQSGAWYVATPSSLLVPPL
jgi:hypothetical protein